MEDLCLLTAASPSRPVKRTETRDISVEGVTFYSRKEHQAAVICSEHQQLETKTDGGTDWMGHLSILFISCPSLMTKTSKVRGQDCSLLSVLWSCCEPSQTEIKETTSLDKVLHFLIGLQRNNIITLGGGDKF